MKALVPFAGAGIRSRPSTHAPAEQPVPVAPQPVSSHGLESLADATITLPDARVTGRQEQPEHPGSDPTRVNVFAPPIHDALLPGPAVPSADVPRSGTPADADRVGPTRSRALDGPAPRPVHGAPARDRWTEVAPDSHRDRRSALHEALPHIREEISQ